MEVQMDAIRAKRRRRGTSVLLAILIILALVMGSLALSVALRGKKMRSNDVYVPQVSQPGQTEEQTQIDDIGRDYITYQGKKYKFNDDIATFLLLGIDSNTPDTFEPGNCNVMAFSDAVILAAMDFKHNQITFFTVSRDAMCEYMQYSPDGEQTTVATGQLCIPFSYGDGREKSLEITKDAVSGLFGNLPIYSCSAMYLEGLGEINEAAGGVTLEPIETVEQGDIRLEKGELVTLNPEEAEVYIRWREHTKTGNLDRMERQKHYFKTLVMQLYTACRKNIRTALRVYNAVKDNVVTDIKLSDIIYLATKATKMHITEEIRSVPGEVELSEDNYAEYYIDDEGCFELLLSIYYEQVPE